MKIESYSDLFGRMASNPLPVDDKISAGLKHKLERTK